MMMPMFGLPHTQYRWGINSRKSQNASHQIGIVLPCCLQTINVFTYDNLDGTKVKESLAAYAIVKNLATPSAFGCHQSMIL